MAAARTICRSGGASSSKGQGACAEGCPPYTDAVLTTRLATKKASRHLSPGENAIALGAGGLGHTDIQVLATLCASEIIVVDRAEPGQRR
jgi:D-arabinose 1-dehydrogenase-like Zn-dependent alcohol dehydrogenase